ncbi:unnamed protein product [Caretta caretta]
MCVQPCEHDEQTNPGEASGQRKPRRNQSIYTISCGAFGEGRVVLNGVWMLLCKRKQTDEGDGHSIRISAVNQCLDLHPESLHDNLLAFANMSLAAVLGRPLITYLFSWYWKSREAKLYDWGVLESLAEEEPQQFSLAGPDFLSMKDLSPSFLSPILPIHFPLLTQGSSDALVEK